MHEITKEKKNQINSWGLIKLKKRNLLVKKKNKEKGKHHGLYYFWEKGTKRNYKLTRLVSISMLIENYLKKNESGSIVIKWIYRGILLMLFVLFLETSLPPTSKSIKFGARPLSEGVEELGNSRNGGARCSSSSSSSSASSSDSRFSLSLPLCFLRNHFRRAIRR